MATLHWEETGQSEYEVFEMVTWVYFLIVCLALLADEEMWVRVIEPLESDLAKQVEYDMDEQG